MNERGPVAGQAAQPVQIPNPIQARADEEFSNLRRNLNVNHDLVHSLAEKLKPVMMHEYARDKLGDLEERVDTVASPLVHSLIALQDDVAIVNMCLQFILDQLEV